MSDLDSFVAEADKRSPFLSLQDGIPVEGIYKGAKLVDNTFQEGTKIMQYGLEIDGVIKTFKSASVKLARLMKGIVVGDTIEVVKTGTSFKTQWYITKK